MSAALALTTDRSMFPKDLTKELQKGGRTDRARQPRQRDHIGWLKSLDGCGPVTEVLTLLYPWFAMLSPSPTLAKVGDGAVYGV